MLETSPKSKKARRPRPAGFFHSAVAGVSQNASPMPVPMPTAAAPPPPTAAPTPVPTATAPPPPQQSSQSQHPPDETAAAAAVPTAAAPPPPPATAAPVPTPTAATSAKLRVLPRKVRDTTRSACTNRFILCSFPKQNSEPSPFDATGSGEGGPRSRGRVCPPVLCPNVITTLRTDIILPAGGTRTSPLKP